MRDPSRIDRVLHAIRAVWCQLPDFRLGQLILATVHSPEGPNPELYDIEDEELIRTLEHLADRWGLDDPSPVDVVSRLAWDVARLFPEQGEWEAEDYLRLKTNRLVELSDGRLEVLPWPTTSHQAQSGYLGWQLDEFASADVLGMTLFAPLPVRLGARTFRMPDVVFMRNGHADRIGEQYWDGADLVMEVVGDDDRRRDFEVKRHEYAQAGIPEYWIVDPMLGRIVVLQLDGGRYVEHGTFVRGQQAASAALPGFEVDVTAALTGRP